MNIAFECLFGSHLYGTSTENSDTDYLGVFIPSREEILLQRCPDVIRVGYQILDILTKGDLVFPLNGSVCNHLIDIKQGKFDYESEIKLEIEVLMNEVLMRCSMSNLPDEILEADKSRLDKFIFTQHYKACQPDFWS